MARGAARRVQAKNNLKQILLALHNYHDEYGRFPPPFLPNDKLPVDRRLSWMVLVLPYLEEQALYNAVNQELAWDSTENRTAARTSVQAFLNPAASTMTESSGYALTHVAGVSGWGDEPNGIFSRSTSLSEITDGASLTAVVGEVRYRPGPWIAAGPSTVRPMEPHLNRDSLTFGSDHEGGLHLGFPDGTVRFISDKIDAKTLQALATCAGGESLD